MKCIASAIVIGAPLLMVVQFPNVLQPLFSTLTAYGFGCFAGAFYVVTIHRAYK